MRMPGAMPPGKIPVAEGADVVRHAQLAMQQLVVVCDHMHGQQQPEQDIYHQKPYAGQHQPHADLPILCSQGDGQQQKRGSGHHHQVQNPIAYRALPQSGTAAASAAGQYPQGRRRAGLGRTEDGRVLCLSAPGRPGRADRQGGEPCRASGGNRRALLYPGRRLPAGRLGG